MAATTAISGHDGSISGPTGMTEVTNWKCDITIKELEATSMASAGYEEFIEGLKGATFSGSCQGTVLPARGLSAVTLKTKSTGGISVAGSAIIGKVGITDPVDGKVTYDFDGKFTGSITIS